MRELLQHTWCGVLQAKWALHFSFYFLIISLGAFGVASVTASASWSGSFQAVLGLASVFLSIILTARHADLTGPVGSLLEYVRRWKGWDLTVTFAWGLIASAVGPVLALAVGVASVANSGRDPRLCGPVVVFWGAWLLIAYTYCAFPVILELYARVREIPEASEPQANLKLPRVAMVVPAFNEELVLPAKLANTWAIDYPAERLQIVIGSDGSSDMTGEILRGCQDARLDVRIFTERRGRIAVLNDLVSTVDADIVVLSDAAMMFAPDALRRLVAPFVDQEVGCVSGELVLEHSGGMADGRIYRQYESWIKRNESRLGFLIGPDNGVFAIRRSLYCRLPSSTILEEFVLRLRVLEQGFRVAFEPAARATLPPCPSARAEMARKARIGAGGFQALGLTRSLLHPKYGLCAFAYWGHMVMRAGVPLFLITALLANVALADVHGYGALLAMQAGGVSIAWCSYWAGRRTILPAWIRPVSYFYLTNFAMLCGFLRLLRKTDVVRLETNSG